MFSRILSKHHGTTDSSLQYFIPVMRGWIQSYQRLTSPWFSFFRQRFPVNALNEPARIILSSESELQILHPRQKFSKSNF